MIEPLSLTAGAITLLILTKGVEKVGEKLGEAALEKSGAAIQAARKAVQDKLQAEGKTGVLKQAEENPTERNVEKLEAELVSQMEEDQAFAHRLRELVSQIKAQSPSLQVIIDSLRARRVEMDNVTQRVSKKQGSITQLIGSSWQIEEEVKLSDVIQDIEHDRQ
jgi:ribosome recycling factor